MKILGLIGGMSWESTSIYYRLINEMVKQRLGGLHSAKIILWSFDFDEIATLQSSGDWNGATKKMIEAGVNLKNAGADTLVICTNTMHKMAADIEKESGLTVLHIADATAIAIKNTKIKTIGLLATRFTMEQEFYKGRLSEHHQIETLIPVENERVTIHKIIYDELCNGIIKESSKKLYLDIIYNLIKQGAQGIILGCTEIGMLIQQEDISIPIFDTTTLHAEAAVNYALSE